MKKILFVLVLFAALGVKAQNESANLKSMFIYHFTKYIKWPQQVDKFTIGIYNHPEMYSALVDRFGENGNFELREIHSAEEVTSCEVVILGKLNSGDLSRLLQQTNGTATLLVTDNQQTSRKYAGINFVVKGNKLKFELIENNLQSAGLQASADLRKVAIVI